MVIRRINIDILRYLAPMNQGRHHHHHHHQHCNLRLSWASLGPVFIGCGSQFYKFVGQSRYAALLLDHFRKCGNCMHSRFKPRGHVSYCQGRLIRIENIMQRWYKGPFGISLLILFKSWNKIILSLICHKSHHQLSYGWIPPKNISIEEKYLYYLVRLRSWTFRGGRRTLEALKREHGS